MKRKRHKKRVRLHTTGGRGGFTLIEVAVAMRGVGMLSLLVASLLFRTIDAYEQAASESYMIPQVRHCLDMVSQEIRESMGCRIVDPAAAEPDIPARDVVLLTSARSSDGTFFLDANGFPSAQSIVLYYQNTTPEGIMQLVRHQLFYAEDFAAYAPPFILASVPYAGDDIVIVDNYGTALRINRMTGTVEGTAPVKTPRSLINHVSSLDVVWNGIDPIEIIITCETVDRKGHTAIGQFSKQVAARNL